MNNKNQNFTPNKQLRRLLILIKALTRNRFGLTKCEIFDRFRQEDIDPPSNRTFLRDIAELKVAGYEITCDTKNEYRYVLINREEVISEAFSLEEIQALQMSRDLFGYFDGTHLKETIDSAINAVIGSQKTPFSKEDIAESEQNFMVRLGWHRDFFDKKELLDSVVFGVNSSTKLKITYKKPNKEAEICVVEPYKIVLYHDTLYLLAQKENENRGLHLYHISRFENVEETGVEFTKDKKLAKEYEEKLQHSFGIGIEGDLCDIEIEFDKSVEYVIRERNWHNSQIIETTGDSVILKLLVYNSGEFNAWVRSWGDVVKNIKTTKVAP